MLGGRGALALILSCHHRAVRSDRSILSQPQAMKGDDTSSAAALGGLELRAEHMHGGLNEQLFIFLILYFHLRPRNSCRLVLARAPSQEARALGQGAKARGSCAHPSQDQRPGTPPGGGLALLPGQCL